MLCFKFQPNHTINEEFHCWGVKMYASKMTKMANSLAGYIALLRQIASFCKGWGGDCSIKLSLLN